MVLPIRKVFPEDFSFGAATASYQVEGAAWEDGRGESIWDRFARTPGRVFQQHNGDVACDHYHRYESDLDLLQDLGVDTYRFSIAWPRVVPEQGKVLVHGLDFYKRLIEGLHRRDIKPAATMYHWDLPQWIQDAGGWAARTTVDRFMEYAEIVFRELGDSVPMWITHNEPWCAAFLSHGLGVHAPGLKDWDAAAKAAHHILLSHGLTVQQYRASGLNGQIGITLNLDHVYPVTTSAEDLAAADRQDAFQNRWFLDPLFKATYPEVLKDALFNRFVPSWDFIREGDLETIATPIDFLGVNYYQRSYVRHDENDPLLQIGHPATDYPHTDMGWEVYPQGLYDLLQRVRDDYTGELPLYITENGAAYPDEVVDGQVDDPERVRYLHDHLEMALKFVNEGGPLKGYYAWSLMDNFEWAEGYAKRFGIVYTNYETQQRIPKTSAKFYQTVARTHEMPII